MKTVVGFPSNARFAQQVALAFLEAGLLEYFATTFVFDDRDLLGTVLKNLPSRYAAGAIRGLQRRSIKDIPKAYVDTYPFGEILRTVAQKLHAGPIVVDWLWDKMSHDYTRHLARFVPSIDAIYAYEYTALEAFQRAKDEGVARILDFPSLNSRQYEALQREEKARFSDLASPHDGYFEKKFEQRQARRDSEMALADVIITNSNLTRRSHVAGGADPQKTFAVPYGAPPPLPELPPREAPRGSLNLIWAGTFSIRKGAHYLLEAWRELDARGAVKLDIFGATNLPSGLMGAVPDTITFKGSVNQKSLFEAFDRADALIFPTLSDGFGMVVTEALARGLPVITTDQAGAADLIKHKSNGLIIPARSREAIGEAIEWCLDNREALFAMRHAALESARGWQWSDYRRALLSAVASGLTGTKHASLLASISAK